MQLGRYELMERIGEGAMAEVWLAFDPSIDRVLAIKLLKPEYCRDAAYADRFIREAKAVGALAHPSIVTIYDAGSANGFLYIAMELVDGVPLDRFIADEGPAPDERVLSIGAQLAAGLHYAHQAGVVHRDIKPSNIMVSKDGQTIKILDFGIARIGEVESDSSDHLRTQIGQVLGTPRYMSPEQARGQTADGRSDLFSVGCVLYELITGQPAFSGPNPATLALKIIQQNPRPIAELAPNCSGGLRFIVDKLLAKRPEKRFANATELIRALDRESKALEAIKADDAARGHYLPLQIKLTVAMVAITTVVLTLSIGAVLDRQYRLMERIAVASGSSIAAFVASNAALPAVDNAAMAPEQRDWAPTQAFIAAAAKDQAVRWMTMVDADGVVRGASNPALLGTRYREPVGESIIEKGPDVTVTNTTLENGRHGFRFVHPIFYAGRKFGLIEVSISKGELEAAADLARNLMVALGAILMAVVAVISFVVARLVVLPVRRLKRALRDATKGDLDFRMSHGRKDEFGELFDGFNLLLAAFQERLLAAERPSGASMRAVEATQIRSNDAALKSDVLLDSQLRSA